MSKEPIYYGVDMAATGRHISELRKARGLTVKEIQEYMGFEMPQAIYRWERGETIPKIEHLKVLSQVLGVSIDELLIWSHPPPAARNKLVNRKCNDSLDRPFYNVGIFYIYRRCTE